MQATVQSSLAKIAFVQIGRKPSQTKHRTAGTQKPSRRFVDLLMAALSAWAV